MLTLLNVIRPQIIHEFTLCLSAKDVKLRLVHSDRMSVPSNRPWGDGNSGPFLRSCRSFSDRKGTEETGDTHSSPKCTDPRLARLPVSPLYLLPIRA